MPQVSAESLVSQAQSHWQQWLSNAGEAGAAIAADSDLVATLLRVFEGSEYVALSCLRDPDLLPNLLSSNALKSSYPPGEMASRLAARLEPVKDEDGLHRELRKFRRAEMVRIIWRDLAGWALLGETLEDLSALADACVDQTLAILYAWATAKQGVPRDKDGVEQKLVVIGMGKLGARELNLSSDIDLIFCFPRHGEVDGPRRPANEQFFTRLCQQLVKAINSATVDGFVFRVDTRLRPFGEAGPLALSFDAMESYYESQAREWERYAMIKARVVGGDMEAGAQLMNILRPFVYRRYLDYGVVESLREMKQLISRELLRKGIADNVKLGPGGIREIEFIGQAFQLIRGGRDPELQIRPILQVLQRLEARNLLPDFAVRELSTAYEFLRLVENRVQAWQDRQTHLLPEDETGRLRLARSMNFASWDEFFPVLQRHRKRVQGHFDQVFAAPQAEQGEGEGGHETPLATLWRDNLDAEQAQAALGAAGFANPDQAVERLAQFRDSRACNLLGERGRRRLDQLGPLLMQAVAGAEQPDLTLERLLKLLEAVVRRTAYLALLVESPLALSQLVRLAGVSPWIVNQLIAHPLLLDELLDPRRLYTPLNREALDEELAALLGTVAEDDQEQRMERLRQFAQSNRLRVAAADITGVIPLMVVSDYLTWTAEAAVAQVLEMAWEHLRNQHGHPGGVPEGEKGFVVIGYGKLGGIELGYGSDLDLVFLHQSPPHAQTAGPRQITDELFYARLGQRMINIFTTRMSSGLLYEIDMRLRPNGKSGLLVSSLEAFAQYQDHDAWTWEHQALLRARAIAGDPRLAERFEEIRRQILCRERDGDKLREEVREMREKMRESLDETKEGAFDLKQGRGGIADIEFMVQYSVLRWASRWPDLIEWSDNIRQLRALARHAIFDPADATALQECYRRLRARYHHNTLRELPALAGAEEFLEERGRVEGMWRRVMEAPNS